MTTEKQLLAAGFKHIAITVSEKSKIFFYLFTVKKEQFLLTSTRFFH